MAAAAEGAQSQTPCTTEQSCQGQRTVFHEHFLAPTKHMLAEGGLTRRTESLNLKAYIQRQRLRTCPGGATGTEALLGALGAPGALRAHHPLCPHPTLWLSWAPATLQASQTESDLHPPSRRKMVGPMLQEALPNIKICSISVVELEGGILPSPAWTGRSVGRARAGCIWQQLPHGAA